MNGKPNDNQPPAPSINEETPKQPAENGVQRPRKEKEKAKADDREGQTREPGYDEA